jgi:hypothetical protein
MVTSVTKIVLRSQRLAEQTPVEELLRCGEPALFGGLPSPLGEWRQATGVSAEPFGHAARASLREELTRLAEPALCAYAHTSSTRSVSVPPPEVARYRRSRAAGSGDTRRGVPPESRKWRATNVAEYSVLGVSSIKLTKIFSGKLFKTFLRGINEY